jgi:hypothetical protein
MHRTPLVCAALFLLASCLCSCGSALRAEEYYFGLIFGSQSHPKLLRYTHTWATFVRAVGEGPDLSTYTLYAHTISWYPRTLDVNVWDPRPEPGINLDLQQTFAIVRGNNERVMLWGPFVMSAEVYNRSLRVKEALESGRAQYRAISTTYDLFIADCIHAVAAVDTEFGREHYPLIRIGNPASRFIARQVMTRSIYDQWQYNNAWIVPRLGIDPASITIVRPQQIPKRSCFLCRCPD